MSGRPLRFLAGVLAAWTGARLLVLLPGADQALAPAPAPIRRLLGLPGAPAQTPPRIIVAKAARPNLSASRIATDEIAAPAPALRPIAFHLTEARGNWTPATRAILISAFASHRRGWIDETALAGPPPGPAEAGRWTGDAYLFVRGNSERSGPPALAPGGELGGGQAFARLGYRVSDDGRLVASVRGSRALEGPGTEAALGLSLALLAAPLRVAVERRVAVDSAGRDAWAVYIAGGVDGRRLGPLRLDAYAQAGAVGASRRDGFVDGAVRLGRPIGRVSLGGGLWGAAQPGAARLDLGPQLSVRLPAGASAALDWRLRAAGDARPGSGLALTIAAGF